MKRGISQRARFGMLMVTAALATIALGGCGLTSHGTELAVYKLPPTDRIAVVVDAAGGSGADVNAPDDVGRALTDHLYTYKVSDQVVDPARIDYLRRNGTLRDLSLQAIAAKLDAKLVLYVRLTQFRLEAVGDTGYYSGFTSATVRLVDAAGKKLWPKVGEDPDFSADVQADRTLNREDARKYLIDLLTVRIGRSFHDYSRDDPYISR